MAVGWDKRRFAAPAHRVVPAGFLVGRRSKRACPTLHRRKSDSRSSDNGPEFIAKVIKTWLTNSNVKTLYIPPGAPWENGSAESFHSRLRDEFLNAEEFDNLAHARVLRTTWKLDDNHRRPHSALDYQNDRLNGGDGNDRLNGNGGKDRLLGGAGKAKIRSTAKRATTPDSAAKGTRLAAATD